MIDKINITVEAEDDDDINNLRTIVVSCDFPKCEIKQKIPADMIKDKRDMEVFIHIFIKTLMEKIELDENR